MTAAEERKLVLEKLANIEASLKQGGESFKSLQRAISKLTQTMEEFREKLNGTFLESNIESLEEVPHISLEVATPLRTNKVDPFAAFAEQYRGMKIKKEEGEDLLNDENFTQKGARSNSLKTVFCQDCQKNVTLNKSLITSTPYRCPQQRTPGGCVNAK